MSITEEMQSFLSSAGGGLDRQMERSGLSLAVVTNVNDEEKLNRVKCLPIESDQTEETDWCYVMTPFGGKACGQMFFPNVNDLVVLGYLGGDPHRPMVLGAYWNTETPPPYTVQEGKVQNYAIKTPGGTELLFYDEPEKQRATLTLPSGTVLSMDDASQTVVLKDKAGDNALEMDLKGGNITLKAKTKLVLSAGGTTITLEAGGNVSIQANQEISMQAATLTEKGTAKVAVQGAEVEVKASASLNLQASGIAALKGAMVNLN